MLDPTGLAARAREVGANVLAANVEAAQANTRHDHAERRATVRRGRERGWWLYVPAEQLKLTYTIKVSYDPPPPDDLFQLHGAELDEALEDAVVDWAASYNATAYVRDISAVLA